MSSLRVCLQCMAICSPPLPAAASSQTPVRPRLHRVRPLTNPCPTPSTSCPTPACSYVLHYLMRLQPFTGMAVALQGGHFDKPDRLFLSVEQVTPPLAPAPGLCPWPRPLPPPLAPGPWPLAPCPAPCPCPLPLPLRCRCILLSQYLCRPLFDLNLTLSWSLPLHPISPTPLPLSLSPTPLPLSLSPNPLPLPHTNRRG